MNRIVLAMLCFAASIAAAAAPSKWTVMQIGSAWSSFAESANNRGDVTGWMYGPSGVPVHHAFLWQNGVVQDLGVPPGWTQTDGVAINNGGTIAISNDSTGIALWRDGAWDVTGIRGTPAAINEGGTLAGEYFGAYGPQVFTYKDGRFTDLGTLGGVSAFARAINDSGTVVGFSSLPGNPYLHAFVAEHGTMRDIGTLGGNYSWAYAVNNAGTVVGVSEDSSGHDVAMIWDGAQMRPLLSAGTMSVARAINDRGQIVGSVDNGSFLYDSGVVTRLEAIPEVAAAGWTWLTPYAINDRGWIVGTGARYNYVASFLLIPR
jgi:probable HAF family extracellular repeat protein